MFWGTVLFASKSLVSGGTVLSYCISYQPVIEQSGRFHHGKFPAFCLSFITMALGIAMLLLFIPLAHQQIIGRELLFLGAATFVSGLFLTTDCRYLQLVYGNAHIYHMVAETAMQLIIPPFLLFLCHMYDNTYSKKISTILCFICELTFAGCFICEISGIRDYHQTLILTHIMFAISMIFTPSCNLVCVKYRLT